MEMFFDMLNETHEIVKLNSKFDFLQSINKKIEGEEDSEIRLALLEEYLNEFNSFINECVEFYSKTITSINKYMEGISDEKNTKIKELQDSVSSLTQKLLEEKYSHEKQIEQLGSMASNEPEKVLKLLSSIHMQSAKHKVFLN